jgi:fructose-specific phosphotransferase system IIC component
MKVGKFQQYLLSGVSYAIPFVASGGILIALSIALAPMGPGGPDFSRAPFLKLINDIGTAAFSLLVPVLSGYIAFGVCDRPGLVPGFVVVSSPTRLEPVSWGAWFPDCWPVSGLFSLKRLKSRAISGRLCPF